MGHIALYLSVSQFVDQFMSVQYLQTLLLECCQTWYSKCPKRAEVPYLFSGHMGKGHVQTAGL